MVQGTRNSGCSKVLPTHCSSSYTRKLEQGTRNLGSESIPKLLARFLILNKIIDHGKRNLTCTFRKHLSSSFLYKRFGTRSTDFKLYTVGSKLLETVPNHILVKIDKKMVNKVNWISAVHRWLEKCSPSPWNSSLFPYKTFGKRNMEFKLCTVGTKDVWYKKCGILAGHSWKKKHGIKAVKKYYQLLRIVPNPILDNLKKKQGTIA